MNRGLVASPSSSPASSIWPPRVPSYPFCGLKSIVIGSGNVSRIRLRCLCSSKPGSPSGQGDNESKSVLDAFFLGKALAETINERVESAVGEFLSAIGRLQSDQQKQVQDFQEEVLERAKRAKDRATKEAMEAEGPKDIVAVTTNGVPAQSEYGVITTNTNEDPLLGLSNEE